MSTKEITEKKEADIVAATEEEMAAWGGDNDLEVSDIIIPKILLMQSDSKLVQDDASPAKDKDFINSSTKEVMTDITFTPFEMKKVMKISKKVGNSVEYVREEPWTLDNDDMDKEWTIEKETFISQKVWRFFGLVEGEAMPFVLDLRGMSFSAGKRLANQMYVINKMKKMVPAGYKVSLKHEKSDYDGVVKNTFTYALSKPTSKAELEEALQWKNIIRTKDIILGQEDEEQDTPAYNDVDTTTPEVKDAKPSTPPPAKKAENGKEMPW